MRIRRIDVENFRALRDSTLKVSDTTALLGENNCGKSAFLLALDLFFSNAPKVNERDFSDGDTSDPIDITVHFGSLTPSERDEFESNLLGDELIVTRRLIAGNPKESGQFFVSAEVNPDFSECRNEAGKTEKRELYKSLQESYDLPNVKNADEIDGNLEAWEAKNPEKLERRRVAGFKGFKNVAVGKIKLKTDFVLIRAVEDAAANFDGDKNSPVRNLINTIARQTIENSAEYKEFMAEANQRIAELTDPEKVPVLSEISDRLTNILEGYYRDSKIIATWDPITQIPPSFPTAAIEVNDHDFTTGIDGVGHGLQRAVILTVLQFMAEHRATVDAADSGFDEPQSDIIIAIEEPEIYQHPTKQRLFAKLLRRLAADFNHETGIRIQTVYVTHSPLMVSLSQCESIRMIRRQVVDERRTVKATEINLADCSLRSAEVSGRPPEDAWSAAQYAAKLHTFSGEIAEGFFSKCTILVEGVGDKAVLEAWYRLSDRDPHSEGIVISDVTGKNNLDKPIVIFDALEIPCFWVFDNDKGAGEAKNGSIKANKILQRLGGVPEDECVDWPEGVSTHYAVWDYNLEEYVKSMAGHEKFDSVREVVAEEFDIDSDMCLKFPASASKMLATLKGDGLEFPELEAIVAAVDGLLGG